MSVIFKTEIDDHSALLTQQQIRYLREPSLAWNICKHKDIQHAHRKLYPQRSCSSPKTRNIRCQNQKVITSSAAITV